MQLTTWFLPAGLLTTIFFIKLLLQKPFPGKGKLTGTYDILLQSAKGTQRLTLMYDGDRWRAGEEIEQVGIIRQDLSDLLGSIIDEVRKQNELMVH
jgi:hypothetical protein